MNDQEKYNDEIRDLLRKKLEAGAGQPESWNVPSTKVWGGISEELAAGRQPARKAHFNRWLGMAMLALLALLLLRECTLQGRMGAMRSEFLQLQQEYKTLRETCEEKYTDTGKNEAQEASQKTATDQLPAVSKPTIEENSGFRPVRTDPFTPTIFIEKKTTPAGQKPIIETGAGSSISTDTSIVLQQRSTLDLSFLPAVPISFFETKVPGVSPDLHFPQKNPSGAGLPIVASIYGGLALTGNRLAGEKPAIIARQKALLGWQTGIDLEAVLSRQWSVEAGLRYSVSRVQTDYRLAVPFTHINEYQHDDGNFDNEYNHSLPSSLGNYPAQFILTRESTANVEEGEVMNLDLSIRQRTNLLSLPFHLRYGFGKHRWQVGVRTGLVANRLLAVASEDAPELVSHHGAIHQRHTSVGNPSLKDLQKNTLDASLGLDLRYQLSPRFCLSLETAWQHGLTPVFKDELVRNYLWDGAVRVGVRYGFDW